MTGVSDIPPALALAQNHYRHLGGYRALLALLVLVRDRICGCHFGWLHRSQQNLVYLFLCYLALSWLKHAISSTQESRSFFTGPFSSNISNILGGMRRCCCNIRLDAIYTWTTGFNRFSVIKFALFFVLGLICYRWLRYKSRTSIVLGVPALLGILQSYILYKSSTPEIDAASTTLVLAVGLVLFAGLACVSRVDQKI